MTVGPFFWKIAKWFLFRMDAETAHHLTVRCIRLGITFKNVPLRIVSGSSRRDLVQAPLPQVFGMEFHSRLGLAAGFDKNAEILTGLPALGFGFAEIGTVTPRPQPGNERPRLFRDPARQALFNRMGFNGLGATIISERLAQARKSLPPTFRVGVNLGKNKDTPLQSASEDYVRAARLFEGLADYLVINVSSPNTPGLRSLQTVEALKPIVGDLVELIAKWGKRPPLLLKVSPELRGAELQPLIQSLEPMGIDGWILTNTLGGEFDRGGVKLQGGWSGQPLTEKARESLIEARQMSRKPIVSVGGICSSEEASARLLAGASLLQIYTSWIYGGPGFPVALSRKISSLKT